MTIVTPEALKRRGRAAAVTHLARRAAVRASLRSLTGWRRLDLGDAVIRYAHHMMIDICEKKGL